MRTLTKLAASLVLSCSFLYAADANRKIIQRVEPEYPEVARKLQIHGTVKLKVWILANGTVSRVEYLGGHPMLAEAAINAIHKWKFEPAPHDTTMPLEVTFASQ